MNYNARRLLDDDKPNGYLESDKDYVENNLELVVRLLENFGQLGTFDGMMRVALTHFPQSEIGEDNDGQLVIYTDKAIDKVGNVLDLDDVIS